MEYALRLMVNKYNKKAVVVQVCRYGDRSKWKIVGKEIIDVLLKSKHLNTTSSSSSSHELPDTQKQQRTEQDKSNVRKVRSHNKHHKRCLPYYMR